MAVIFDMDGVLVDSEVHWRKIESDFLVSIIPHWNEDLQHSIVGMSFGDVHRILSEKHGLKLTREEYTGFYQNLAQEIYGRRVAMISGARELMAQIAAEKRPLAIASSSPKSWIEIVVKRFDLSPFLRGCISSDDVGGKGKPAPDIYLAASKCVAVDPQNCVAIEDSAKGVASAKAAGLRCLGFRNGFNDRQNLSAADAIVSDFGPQTLELLLSF